MEINISHDSWHYRFYQWWMTFGNVSKPDWFKENLCHYVRVVLIWAPLGWFLRKPILGGALRPWIVWAALMTMLGTIIGLYINPALTISFWALYISVLLFLACMFGLAWLISNANEAAWNILFWILVVICAPVWIPVVILYLVLRFAWNRAIKPLYFQRHRFIWLLWLVTILAIPVVIYLVWGMGILITVGIGVGLIILGCLAILMLIFFVLEGIPAILEWIRSRLRRRSRYTEYHPRRPGISTAGLLREYRKTKWGSIVCPFINLPHQWD